MLSIATLYYRLAKPGIIRGNIITAVAAFIYGSQGVVELWTLGMFVLGSSLIIGSACVFNNLIDTDIDAHMSRTKNRELVQRVISRRAAKLYGLLLGLVGLVVLQLGTNILTVTLGLVGFVSYVWPYTLSKRRTPYSTLIGTIPGATPPVAGYLAATNRLDLTCIFFFVILLSWQMPHFLAIALRRIDEYRAAKIPLLPIVKGIHATKVQIIAYTALFLLSTLGIGIYAHVGVWYLIIMSISGCLWLYKACNQGMQPVEEWAKHIFLLSLVTLLIFDVCIALVPYI